MSKPINKIIVPVILEVGKDYSHGFIQQLTGTHPVEWQRISTKPTLIYRVPCGQHDLHLELTGMSWQYKLIAIEPIEQYLEELNAE